MKIVFGFIILYPLIYNIAILALLDSTLRSHGKFIYVAVYTIVTVTAFASVHYWNKYLGLSGDGNKIQEFLGLNKNKFIHNLSDREDQDKKSS